MNVQIRLTKEISKETRISMQIRLTKEIEIEELACICRLDQPRKYK